ncbi:DUF2749 domain-containing protein [Devosia sp. LjRoot3]|uniref:DUF2749 domain-containing protein n=1 Tax=Devosia sp. LjRoot3 TaxID=3342319 RepID=UPI003ECC5655
MRTILLATLVLLVAGCITGWLFMDASKRQARDAFFSTEKTYDTTGGQEMRPRW